MKEWDADSTVGCGWVVLIVGLAFLILWLNIPFSVLIAGVGMLFVVSVIAGIFTGEF